MSIEYKDPIHSVTPGGRIRFFKSLGIDRNYKNSIFFSSKAEQETFFANQASGSITYNDGSTSPPTMVIKSPFIRTFLIPTNSAELFPYDYIEVTPNTSSSGAMAKKLYMFITGVSFVNDNVAQIECELDVIQTFMFDWALGTQTVEQMHSDTIYSPFSEELKVDENFQPAAIETASTLKFSQQQTNSDGYMIIATEVPYGVSVLTGEWKSYGFSSTDLNGKIAPIGERDGNQMVYIYCGSTASISAEEALDNVLWAYNEANKMNTIKKVLACPAILNGNDARGSGVKWVSFGTIGKPDLSDFESYFPGCSPRVVGAKKYTQTISAPSNVNGYVPMDTKTFNLLELEVSTITDEKFVLSNDAIFSNEIDLTIEGVFSVDPQILIYPSVNSSPAIPGNTSGGIKDYKAPVISLMALPSFAIYNKDAEEAFYNQEVVANLGNIVGTIGRLVSGGAMIGGFI